MRRALKSEGQIERERESEAGNGCGKVGRREIVPVAADLPKSKTAENSAGDDEPE